MIAGEAQASWMKPEEVCIQLYQGGVSTMCTDMPCNVDSVADHVVVAAFQEQVAFMPVVVPEPFHDTS